MLPTVFISHGAPSLFIDKDPTWYFFQELGKNLPPPRFILCVSAHWNTHKPVLTGAPQLETIHDFYGFPPSLYELEYPAVGSEALTESVCALLRDKGCEIDFNRGLDHGAWAPLKLMYPGANIPVAQMSIQPHLDAGYHYRLGSLLTPLREQGVLIICSGSATHNLAEFGRHPIDAAPLSYVKAFDEWLSAAVADADTDALLDYENRAPYALKNHPTPEHFLPLFVALGAAGNASRGVQLHQGYTYGMLAMSAYAWGL